jgi:hypothetical protein
MERRKLCNARLVIKKTDNAIRLPDFGPNGHYIPNANAISLMLLSIVGGRGQISTLIP